MGKSKGITIFFIALLSILAIAITWLMINIMNGHFKLSNFNLFKTVSNTLVLDETYNIDFSRIDIKTTTGDVYIKESSNNEVRVIVYGDKENTTVNTTNNNLSIDIASKNCIGFCFDTTISKVEVYLPNTYNNLINIVNNYGDIQIDKFSNTTIEIEEECGDVAVLGANTIKVKNEYGNIEIGEVKKANIHASAGDVNIDTVNDVTVQNDYGDIIIKNVYNYLNLNNDCGNIELNNIVLAKDSIIKDSLGDVEIKRTNEIYIDAKTNLGDVKVNNNSQKSNVSLKIENGCGDINIDN